MTRAQLRLAEAAHILRVAAGDRSIDDVRNGLALSPTYHRAFDRGLTYLTEALEMRLHEAQVADLKQADRDGGLEAFRATLGKIHLPPDQKQRPDASFIKLANEYRGIAS